jgi:hypothetical protein
VQAAHGSRAAAAAHVVGAAERVAAKAVEQSGVALSRALDRAAGLARDGLILGMVGRRRHLLTVVRVRIRLVGVRICW